MKMKLFAAAAVVAAAVSAPAFAADSYVDANYTHSSGGGSSVNGYQIDGAFNTAPKAGALGFEIDGTYANDTEGFKGSYGSAQASIFARGDNHLLGIYANYADSYSTTGWEGGALAQLYGSNYTLSGSAGYGVVDGVPQPKYWTIGANATFYAAENLSVGASAAYVDQTSGGNQSVTVLGAQAEWKPTASPLSLVLNYANTKPDTGPDANTVSVGARWTFGGKGLKERDQSGVIGSLTHARF